ncbi:MAG: hypothetical protein ACODAC_11635 [Pseudomonadota bacterium]
MIARRPLHARRLLGGALCLILGCNAAAARAPGHTLRIAGDRPPCSAAPGLPVTPDDPGARAEPDGSRCYGTRPPEIGLRLPENRLAWLRRAPRHPVKWVAVGPALVDARELEPAPLGLKLDTGGDTPILEARRERRATLTELTPGAWTAVKLPGGSRLWVLLED